MLPQVNAILISVDRGGFSEDYDRPAGTTPAIWSGNIDAYVQRKIRSGLNENGGLQRALDVTIIVDDSLPVVPQAGDFLVYRLISSQLTFTGRVQNLTTPAELPAISDYFKCYLEEVGAPVTP